MYMYYKIYQIKHTKKTRVYIYQINKKKSCGNKYVKKKYLLNNCKLTFLSLMLISIRPRLKGKIRNTSL